MLVRIDTFSSMVLNRNSFLLHASLLMPSSKRFKPSRLSILLRLPNEILQDVFVLSCNLDLLETCSELRRRLHDDRLLTQIVVRAFSRDSSCQIDQYDYLAHTFCENCRYGMLYFELWEEVERLKSWSSEKIGKTAPTDRLLKRTIIRTGILILYAPGRL